MCIEVCMDVRVDMFMGVCIDVFTSMDIGIDTRMCRACNAACVSHARRMHARCTALAPHACRMMDAHCMCTARVLRRCVSLLSPSCTLCVGCMRAGHALSDFSTAFDVALNTLVSLVTSLCTRACSRLSASTFLVHTGCMRAARRRKDCR